MSKYNSKSSVVIIGVGLVRARELERLLGGQWMRLGLDPLDPRLLAQGQNWAWPQPA